MFTSLPPSIRAARRSLGQSVRAGALALLLLPFLAACSAPAPSAPGLDTTIYAAANTGNVTAIDAANGSIRWRYHCSCVMGMAVDSHHHTLFLTTDDSAVAALDATTGKLAWRSTIGADGMLDKPYLVGSMVIAASHPFPDARAASSLIVALDARSGAQLWRISLPGAITGDLDIHPDQLYASVNTASASSGGASSASSSATSATSGAGPGAIYALRATDGAQVWRTEAPAALVAGPASDQTQVYAPTTFGTVLALRASDGARQWNQNISASSPLSALFVNAIAVYVGDGGGTVRALNTADGAVLWRYTVPNTTTAPFPWYTPSDGGAWVLLTSASAPLVGALSPRDGSVVWSQEAGSEASPPVVLGDDIYITNGNKFRILSLATGAYVAEYDVYLPSLGYTSAEQVDLSDIRQIVVDPS
jgi:outer membrane protein assembly factor BamB